MSTGRFCELKKFSANFLPTQNFSVFRVVFGRRQVVCFCSAGAKRAKKKRLPVAEGAGQKRLGVFLCGLGGRHFGDGFEDAGTDLVGVALGVGPAVFEVAFVVVFDEAVRHAYGGASVGHAPVEFVDGLGFVQAGQAFFVFRAVGFDVLVLVSIKGVH